MQAPREGYSSQGSASEILHHLVTHLILLAFPHCPSKLWVLRVLRLRIARCGDFLQSTTQEVEAGESYKFQISLKYYVSSLLNKYTAVHLTLLATY